MEILQQVSLIGHQCNPGWFYGGLLLIPLPSWEAKGYDTIMFRGPATSLRLPLTHSELSLETILNKVSAV